MADEVDPELLAVWDHLLRHAPDSSALGWLRQMRPVALEGGTLMAAVANDFTRNRVETKLRSWIEQELADLRNRPMALAVTLNPDLAHELEEEANNEPVPLPWESSAP